MTDTCALCGGPVVWGRDHLTTRGAGPGARTLHQRCAPGFDARHREQGEQAPGDVRPAQAPQADRSAVQQAHLPRPAPEAGDLFGRVPRATGKGGSVLHRSRMAQAPLGFTRNGGGETR